MNREEHLDDLIEQYLHGASSPLPVSAGDSARIHAAEALSQLNELEVPPKMAARIEARVRARARAHKNGKIVFLEGRPYRPQPIDHPQRPYYRPPWLVVLTTAALLLLACLGVGIAASKSLPGDLLYGVKQLEQQVALASAGSPADHASLQVSQLQGAISDLETEVNDGRSDDDIMQALSIVATDTRDSQSAVTSLAAGPDRNAIEQTLEETLRNERTTLYQLLSRVDWSTRLAFTQQLGTLGAPVPTVVQVTVDEGSDTTLTLKLTGTNFASGARLVINGTPRGTVSQETPTELIAQVKASDLPGGTYTVGILNPDGTAAQATLKVDNHQDGPGDGDDHGGQGTPSPSGTPGSGDGDDGGR